MTSQVVLDDADSIEVERRAEALTREMAPKTELGALLVRKIAVTSVVSDRATRMEFAASAERVRNAPERFDAGRRDQAGALLEVLHEDPRGNLRRLRAMPEGVDLMLGVWRDLRSNLTRPGKPVWTAGDLVRAANLLGIREEDARTSRLGVLSCGVWTDFAGLTEAEGGDLEEEARQAWSRARIVELIDRTTADLEGHSATLDTETIAVDRAEAGSRALFDASKEGTLLRRYESEASRGFYKAIKEFREVEAEAAARPAPPPEPETPPALGSFREEEADDEPWPTEMPPEHLRPYTREQLESVPPGLDNQGRPIVHRPGPDPAV